MLGCLIPLVASRFGMIGVVILSLGIPAMFHSIESGGDFEFTAIVVGYIVMRVPLIAQWLRAAREDPARARPCRTYAGLILVSQVGWCCLLLVDADPSVVLAIAAVIVLLRARRALPDRRDLSAIAALAALLAVLALIVSAHARIEARTHLSMMNADPFGHRPLAGGRNAAVTIWL
jgi:hypothetical protein